MAEPFVSALFVGRDDPLKKILTWADDPNPPNRFWSIVGPPGVGKSYLLGKVREELDRAPRRVAFWIDLSRDPAIRNPCPDLVAPGGFETWLRAAVEQARQKCPFVRAYEGNIQPEAMLDTLVRDLCDNCQELLPPIMIVDSFEDINEAQRDELQERVLAPFIGRSCTRILLSRRDEYTLYSPALRWNEGKEWLSVMKIHEGDQQLQRRLQQKKSDPQHQETAGLLPLNMPVILKSIVAKYAWNHPGINTFLFERAAARQRQNLSPLLTPADLRECVEATQLLRSISDDEYDFLIAIATRLADDWTVSHLTKALNVNFDDEPLLELFRRGLVFNVDGTQRYKLADGLRELLRASPI